jgi:CheY-like chemotaxis protein
VDDNPTNIKTLQIILEKSGYCTVSAMDGATCIEMAKNGRPDLILLDINMPEMSGIEVCKALDNETLREAFESGGTDYVRKPVNRIELLARIESILTQKILMQKLLEEEKLQGVLEMAGAACHELNQPMQTISGYSELLLMDISENNPLYRNIKTIKEQIDRMGKITRKLMRITKYKTREYLNRKIIDIDQALDSAN